MKKTKYIFVLIPFLFFTIFTIHAQPNESFFAKIESIKNDLFKLSTEQLCQQLDISCKSVPLITADQLKKELNTGNNLLVVNVLTPKYHDDCHIKGSINVPLPELVDEAAGWDRSQKIVIYCALDECDAGEKGCTLLSQMGFEHVRDYKGGIKEWYQLGYPTVGPAQSNYLHMKGLSPNEFRLYPESIVCSRQTRWINRYQD